VVAGSLSRAFAGLRIGVSRTAAPAPVRAAPGVFAGASLRSWPATKPNARPEVLGARAAGGMMQAGSAATVVMARSRDLGFPVAAPAAVRSISATPPREKGLNDFFASFPEIDKDGKPMFPAVGASAPRCFSRPSRGLSHSAPALGDRSPVPCGCKHSGGLRLTVRPHLWSRTCVDRSRAAAKVV
jgi:hypothetical protein